MNKPGIVSCMPKSFCPQPVPGSITAQCADCGETVWVSPSTWQILHDNPGTKIVCIFCTPPDYEINIQPPTPLQLDDIFGF